MQSNIDELFTKVIKNDYCVGCGICASMKGSPLTMKISEDGKYVPFIDSKKNKTKDNQKIDYLSLCPFSDASKNENTIGEQLFSETKGIKYNEYTGFYLKNYAGYVKSGDYRLKGSSGGIGSWIATKLLKENLVDGIIHVKSTNTDNKEALFEYQISNDLDGISKGAKSKYYPVEMSKVIEIVKNNPGRYALIGIPCFIKSINLLAEQDNIIKERIVFTIGLVCGHLKSDMFAKAIGWELGIKPNELTGIDFRKKLDGRKASNYGVEVKGKLGENEVIKSAPTSDLYTTDWGLGFFKYKSCDFCDDVLAETADITIGDAWLPEYVQNSNGTNILVVRNQIIQDIIEKNKNELYLDELSVDKIYESQAGGFRHRREGLAYRLFLKDKNNEWRPQKRITASNKISSQRKKVYQKRATLYEKSFNAFKIAAEENNFSTFISYMDPVIQDYNKTLNMKRPILFRIILRIKRIIANR